MLGILIAIRNFLIATMLGWIGIQFHAPDSDIDTAPAESGQESGESTVLIPLPFSG